jgi:hypothetical protein
VTRPGSFRLTYENMGLMVRRRLPLATLAVLMLSTACSGGGDTPSIDPTTFAASMGSTDLFVGSPQRVQIGLFSSAQSGDVRLVTSGSVALTLTPPSGSGTPVEATAAYIPAFGTPGDASGAPTLTTPGDARGVYGAEDVTFDAAGVWQATVSLTLDGEALQLSTQFQVNAKPALPAPGQRALPTKNLTMSSDVDPVAIDSRAQDGAPVPDPDLHRTTIAAAIAQHRAALVLFATPVYCQSQFCGPSADALEKLAKAGPKDAAYIHVEIWKHFAATGSVVNQGAADWVYRNGDLTEPWLYLIGRDGTIVDRWGPLFDLDEVMRELRQADGS